MAKDKSLLESVSKYFTESSLANIVAKSFNEDTKNVTILSWNFDNDSVKKGDSYLSTVDRVTIKSKIKNEEKETKIFVKSLPNNLVRRESFRSVEFFRNEIMFYAKIGEKFEEFVNSKNQSSLWLIPQCLAYHIDGHEDYIALGDLNPLGFGQAARTQCLTFEQCRDMLEGIARFHGVSFAYKDQHKEDFEERVSHIFETYFTLHHYETWYKKFHGVLVDIAKDALAKEYPGSDGQLRFNSYRPGVLFAKVAELCSRWHAATSIVNQGDSWAPNFLVRPNPSGKLDCLLLDFQLARCGSPALDVSFFIYSCTDKALRDEHYKDLLKIYHDELSRTIKVLGSNPEKIYPLEVFLKEVKEQSIFAVVFGIESIIMGMLTEDESFDLDVIKGDKIDVADVWTVKNIKTSENRRRLADMILHAVEEGFI